MENVYGRKIQINFLFGSFLRNKWFLFKQLLVGGDSKIRLFKPFLWKNKGYGYSRTIMAKDHWLAVNTVDK